MKNNRIRYYLSLWVILFVSIFTRNAQQTDTIYMNNIVSSFKQVTNCRKKVYLHTDKPYYFAGDTIWLKAYLVNAITHFWKWQSLCVCRAHKSQRIKFSSVLRFGNAKIFFQVFIPSFKIIGGW